MLHTSNPIIKHKAGLLNLAEELGNVSKACKVMGVSRHTFYRYQELVEDGGVSSLISKSVRTPILKNRVELMSRPSKRYLFTPSIILPMTRQEPEMNFASVNVR